MSASIKNDEKKSDSDQSITYDEIEQFISHEEETYQIDTKSEIPIDLLKSSHNKSVLQQHLLSPRITQVQNVSLSLEKSLRDIKKNSESESNNKSKITVSNIKTSNVPGPVGLLPILVRSYFLLKWCSLKYDEIEN